MEQIQGAFCKMSNGRDSFEILKAEPELLPKIAIFLRNYGFSQSPMISGLEGHYIDITKESLKLKLGWDIWSGFFIYGEDELGDHWTKTLGEIINLKLKEMFFE